MYFPLGLSFKAVGISDSASDSNEEDTYKELYNMFEVFVAERKHQLVPHPSWQRLTYIAKRLSPYFSTLIDRCLSFDHGSEVLYSSALLKPCSMSGSLLSLGGPQELHR